MLTTRAKPVHFEKILVTFSKHSDGLVDFVLSSYVVENVTKYYIILNCEDATYIISDTEYSPDMTDVKHLDNMKYVITPLPLKDIMVYGEYEYDGDAESVIEMFGGVSDKSGLGTIINVSDDKRITFFGNYVVQSYNITYPPPAPSGELYDTGGGDFV